MPFSEVTYDRSYPSHPRASTIRIERADATKPQDAIALMEEYFEALQIVARDDRQTLLRYLSDPGHGVWVAYQDGAAVGCVLYRPFTLGQRVPAAAVGEIKRLYIRDAYRMQGVASHLLNTVENFASRQAANQPESWLYLDSRDDLREAIAFYRRHGFLDCARYNNNPQATVFMRKLLPSPSPVMVRTFEAGDEEAFRILNEEWITAYFRLEEKDLQVLREPQKYILSNGGQIFMALRGDIPVGCCALLARHDGSFEVAEMGVPRRERGQGIGRKLLAFAISFARRNAMSRLYLETNHVLVNAIHLYESAGFSHIPPERVQPSPYARADVYMEMMLT